MNNILENLYLRYPELAKRPTELQLSRYQLKELSDMEFITLLQLEDVTILTTQRSMNWCRKRAEGLGMKLPP